MIGVGFVQTMARYNHWQNNNLLGAADVLDETELRRDRGAFFGSISGTFHHLLWGDRIWMSRFDGWDPPEAGIPESPGLSGDWASYWASYRVAREKADAGIIAWADGLTDADLNGDVVWYSNGLQAEFERPKWLCVQGLFNHQTHHRGQVHAMLTAAGATPGDTDLFLMPEGM